MSKILNTSSITSNYELPDSTVKEYTTTSNESITENMTTSFTKVRSVSKSYVSDNEEVEVTLVLTNNSEKTIEDVRIADTISNGGTFKEGSMTIDGEAQADFDASNYTLPNNIGPSESVTIKYTMIVAKTETSDVVNSFSTITYNVNEVSDLEEKSNTVEVNIVENKVTIVKTSDKTVVIAGQKLMFQNVIENFGGVKNTDVMFKDPIPEGTTFVEESVTIDGTPHTDLNPETGFKIDDLDVGKKTTITFEVMVN